MIKSNKTVADLAQWIAGAINTVYGHNIYWREINKFIQDFESDNNLEIEFNNVEPKLQTVGPDDYPEENPPCEECGAEDVESCYDDCRCQSCIDREIDRLESIMDAYD